MSGQSLSSCLSSLHKVLMICIYSYNCGYVYTDMHTQAMDLVMLLLSSPVGDCHCRAILSITECPITILITTLQYMECCGRSERIVYYVRFYYYFSFYFNIQNIMNGLYNTSINSFRITIS